MRIAFLVGQFPTLSETFVLNQITGLIERGHEVDIYAQKQGDIAKIHPDVAKYDLLSRTYHQPKMPKNHILRLVKGGQLLFTYWHKNPLALLRSLNIFKYGKQAASLKLLYAAIPMLRQQPYDIVHCHFGSIGLKGMWLQDIGVLQGKLLVVFHAIDITWDIQRLGERIYDRLFEKGDLFLPISKLWQHRLIELGCDESKIIVHRMGIDCSKFSFTPRKLPDDGRVRILTIARLVEKKGVEYGIRAIAKLCQIKPEIEYNIVGNGPLQKNLQQLIEKLNVKDNVRLIGWKQHEEIVEILDRTSILLAPSITSEEGDREGIPVSIMEAMAMGLPIVSTQHSGIPELVEDGISGFLVPEKDVEALAEKLTYLIEHPHLWPQMGQAGRAYVEEHYDINKLNNKLVEIYQKLLM